jgi:YD repeat-containing protein
MRSVMFTGLLFLATGACATDEDTHCINGVCAGDPAETRTFPGPCKAAGIGYARHCSFAYDASARLSRSSCKYYFGSDELHDDEDDAIAVYHYDTAGAILSIDQTTWDALERQRTWTFGAATIDVVDQPTGTLFKQYDRALFAFYPGSLVDRMILRAELGMTKLGSTNYAWTRDGSAWLRSGGGNPVKFTLDAAGRLVSTDPATRRFEYEGGRLATHHENGFDYEYVYDAGGNLIEVIATGLAGSGDVRPYEVYDYSCWGTR